MENKTREEQADFLYRAILSLHDAEECAAFFSDLCTPAEIREMAKRLEAARMLGENRVYTDVAEATGLSSATISRVSRCLKYGSNGYSAVLPRLSEKK